MKALLSEISRESVKDMTFMAKNPQNHISRRRDLAHRQAPDLASNWQRTKNIFRNCQTAHLYIKGGEASSQLTPGLAAQGKPVQDLISRGMQLAAVIPLFHHKPLLPYKNSLLEAPCCSSLLSNGEQLLHSYSAFQHPAKPATSAKKTNYNL